mmetsp:Transcript_11631/g.31726  ORF Transcript_11631/g.31726 Transcript_11631/m.31726 type:complete len:417 (-) Transcript_11631:78-1328(-)
MGFDRDDEAALRLRSIDLYYMNVSPQKSSSSARRQDVQERVNPVTAVRGGFNLVPHRVNAVTPDSDAWRAAQACFGQLIMSGAGKDDGAAANCILLSFREALRRALSELATSEAKSTGYILVAEDDMVLTSSFYPTLDLAMWELRKAPAMGAALHSESLEQNNLGLQGQRLLFEEWPRYPADAKVVPFRTTWPGELVIPDQPVALLLKASRLQEFTELYERRLQDYWAPLDWLLANPPFGGSGVLRLATRNAFCRSGSDAPGHMGTGSDRVEQHRVAEGEELEDHHHGGQYAPHSFPPVVHHARPAVYQAEEAWLPPARPPRRRPVPEGSKPGRKWTVIAGQQSRGLVVRSGALLASMAYKHRLVNGAWVEELERHGDRLHYKRLSGDGPDWGWVSLHSKGSQLLTVEDPITGSDL